MEEVQNGFGNRRGVGRGIGVKKICKAARLFRLATLSLAVVARHREHSLSNQR